MEETNEMLETQENVNNDVIALQSELEETKDKYYRALADYKNLKRRTDERISKMTVLASKHIVSDFLEIVDDIERAAINEINGAIEMYRKSIFILANNNVYQFGREGEEFDSMIHNAISIECDQEKPNNTILRVQKFGYKIGDEVIRVADVIVNKYPEE